MSRVRNHPFLFLSAVLIALISTTALIKIYREVRLQREKHFTIDKATLHADSVHYFRSKGFCFATLQHSLELIDDALILNFSSRIDSAIGENTQTFSINGYFKFNSLNQMIGSVATLTSGDRVFQLSSLGLSTMRLQIVETSEEEVKKLFATEVPGPLVLADISDQYYQIQHPLLHDVAFANDTQLEGTLLKELALGVDTTPCSDEQKKPIQLLPLLQASVAFSKQLSSILPN